MKGIFPIYGNSYYPFIDTDVDTLVTVRLDNDDMIHEDFMQTIVAHIPVFEASGLPRQVYSFTKGYRYYDIAKPPRYPGPNFHAKDLIECEMHNNPFLVLFANLKQKPVRNTDHLVYHTDHGLMPEMFNTVYNNDLRAWVWVYHGGNTASIQCKPGDTVDNKILKEFGGENERIH